MINQLKLLFLSTLLILTLYGCSTHQSVQKPRPSVIPKELVNKANLEPIQKNTSKSVQDAYKHNTSEALKCNQSLEDIQKWYKDQEGDVKNGHSNK